MLGFAYQKLNDNDLAISEYKRFLSHQPEHVQTHFNLAYAYMSEGDCESAVEYFLKVLKMKPQYRESHLHLAKCYKSLGNETLAAKHQAYYKQEY